MAATRKKRTKKKKKMPDFKTTRTVKFNEYTAMGFSNGMTQPPQQMSTRWQPSNVSLIMGSTSAGMPVYSNQNLESVDAVYNSMLTAEETKPTNCLYMGYVLGPGIEANPQNITRYTDWVRRSAMFYHPTQVNWGCYSETSATLGVVRSVWEQPMGTIEPGEAIPCCVAAISQIPNVHTIHKMEMIVDPVQELTVKPSTLQSFAQQALRYRQMKFEGARVKVRSRTGLVDIPQVEDKGSYTYQLGDWYLHAATADDQKGYGWNWRTPYMVDDGNGGAAENGSAVQLYYWGGSKMLWYSHQPQTDEFVVPDPLNIPNVQLEERSFDQRCKGWGATFSPTKPFQYIPDPANGEVTYCQYKRDDCVNLYTRKMLHLASTDFIDGNEQDSLKNYLQTANLQGGKRIKVPVGADFQMEGEFPGFIDPTQSCGNPVRTAPFSESGVFISGFFFGEEYKPIKGGWLLTPDVPAYMGWPQVEAEGTKIPFTQDQVLATSSPKQWPQLAEWVKAIPPISCGGLELVLPALNAAAVTTETLPFLSTKYRNGDGTLPPYTLLLTNADTTPQATPILSSGFNQIATVDTLGAGANSIGYYPNMYMMEVPRCDYMITIEWHCSFREETPMPLFTFSGVYSKRHINGAQLFMGLPAERPKTGMFMEVVEFQSKDLLPPVISTARIIVQETKEEEQVDVRLTGRESYLMKVIEAGERANEALRAQLKALPTRAKRKQMREEAEEEEQKDEEEESEFEDVAI